MLCTGHAGLRDKYARWALALDLAILGSSTWLTGLAFVAPSINLSLTPFNLAPELWTGLLSVTTLFLAIVQLKSDWKARSDAHRHTFDIYAEVKREAGYLLASDEFDEQGYRRILARYDMASAVGLALPEKLFLHQKRQHLLKIAISKHLDHRPGASILLTRVRFWIQDSFGKNDPNV
ncbi:hypothetical protein B0E33_20645 [Roseibium algicola]|uniref:SMODS and SLOG-associating 2TM effector domain-containing protein n=2 Tax=Roseibium algicola TaxID=2857014 RepID=A0ABM6I5I9_9HYPH|nr:hypothetical protein B0E33_20645 [Roseibium aggregatum]